MLDAKPIYKNFSGKEFYYRSLFDENYVDGELLDSIEDYTGFLNIRLIRESSSTSPLPNCYFLTHARKKTPKYELNTVPGFFLAPIRDDPTQQSRKQRRVYGDETPLNAYYCKKVCPHGFYYDFNSLSCRRCHHGCAECSKFEECEICVPGFKKYTNKTFKTHTLEEGVIPNQCHIGCQKGFYLEGFSGRCLECEENCEKCVDSRFVFKEKFDRFLHSPSFCLKCVKPQTKSLHDLIVNTTTGHCQVECRGGGARRGNYSIIKPVVQEYCYTCENGCRECETPKTEVCKICDHDYFLGDDKRCRVLQHTQFYFITMVGLFTMLFIFVCFFFYIGTTWFFFRYKKRMVKRVQKRQTKKRWEAGSLLSIMTTKNIKKIYAGKKKFIDEEEPVVEIVTLGGGKTPSRFRAKKRKIKTRESTSDINENLSINQVNRSPVYVAPISGPK